MDNIKSWFKRYKKILFICFLCMSIIIFTIGLFNYIGMYSQLKININQMTYEDFQDMKISKIGNVTAQKIVDEKPINDINNLKKINGVGNEKYVTLSKVFCTYDTCRFSDYIAILIWDALLITVGVLGMIYGSHKIKEIKNKKRQDHEKITNYINKLNIKKIDK